MQADVAFDFEYFRYLLKSDMRKELIRDRAVLCQELLKDSKYPLSPDI